MRMSQSRTACSRHLFFLSTQEWEGWWCCVCRGGWTSDLCVPMLAGSSPVARLLATAFLAFALHLAERSRPFFNFFFFQGSGWRDGRE